jgi:thioesterase domain-containing protein
MSEILGTDNSAADQQRRKPVVFILPGIADLRVLWEPLMETFDCRIVSYLDWTDLLDRNLSVVVEHVKRQIQDAQPSGELRLIGYSIGGQLGYAVTSALQSAGITVSQLVLLDAGTEIAKIPQPFDRQLRKRIEQLLSLYSRNGIATLIAKYVTLDPMRPVLRRLLRARGTKLPFDFDRYLHGKITIHLMRRMYWPWWREIVESGHSLATPAFLFRASDHASFESEDLGWRQFFSNLIVIPVTATHQELMNSPNIEEIRAKIQSLLATSTPENIDTLTPRE